MLRLPSPSRAALLAALSGALLLTGCTDSSAEALDLEGVASGPCGDLVSTLEEIDRSLRAVAEEDLSPQEAAQRFEVAQDALAPAAQDADTSVRPAVTELVTRLGFYRISVDSNSYDEGRGADVRGALTALADDCRTR